MLNMNFGNYTRKAKILVISKHHVPPPPVNSEFYALRDKSKVFEVGNFIHSKKNIP